MVFVRLENTTDHEILAMANDFRRINDHEPMHSLLAYLSERRRKAAGTDPGPQAA